MTRTAIELKQRLLDGHGAGAELRTLLTKREGHEDVRALIKHEPGTALAALQLGDVELGLAPKASADVLEDVIAIVDNDRSVQELMQLHLTPDRRAELLAGRGDLPSAAVMLATPDDLIRAVRLDMNEESASAGPEYVEVRTEVADDDSDEDDEDALERSDDDEDAEEPVSTASPTSPDPFTNARALLAARAWARKIRDREDYETVLGLPLVGRRSLRSYVICAVWYEAGRPSDLDEVTGDLFTDVGIDPAAGRDELRRLLDGDESEDLVAIDDEALFAAAAALTAARQARELTPEAAQDDAQREAGDLDF